MSIRDFASMLLAPECRVFTTFLSLTFLTSLTAISCLIASYVEPTFFIQGALSCAGLAVLDIFFMIGVGAASDAIMNRK